MILFQGVLDAHDPERFEITLFCYTDDDLAETISNSASAIPIWSSSAISTTTRPRN